MKTYLVKLSLSTAHLYAEDILFIYRLYEELKEHFNLNTQIPSADSYLINELNEWLWMASSRSKIIIALDALNQLDTGSGRTGIFISVYSRDPGVKKTLLNIFSLYLLKLKNRCLAQTKKVTAM